MTDLYLAEGKARDRLWKRVGEILEKLGFPPQRSAYLLERRDPALLPGVLRELESGQFSEDRARLRDSQDS
jgi:hypothetical protein